MGLEIAEINWFNPYSKYTGAAGKPKQSDYDSVLKQCLSGGFVKVFELCNRFGVSRAPMPHLLCAQNRQLMMIRMFAVYKPLQGFAAQKFPDKRPLYVDTTYDLCDCYMSVGFFP